MPSHKHKKKKKSHKRLRKHSSSSSDNSDESPWNVVLSDADSDECNNEERLTPLVRRTYMKYLKEALALNIGECIKHSNESYSESLDDIVQKWSSILEHKAMRSCMISGLYRTSMVSLIRQIKSSTNNQKLYIENKKFSKLRFKLPLNKCSQTELVNCSNENSHTVETQTDDIDYSSFLKTHSPKQCHCSRPYDAAVDFSDVSSNEENVSSSLESKCLESVTVFSANQDICNITSTSDIVDTFQPSVLDLKAQIPEFTVNKPILSHEDTGANSQPIIENNGTEIKSKLHNCDFEEVNLSRSDNSEINKSISIKKRRLNIEKSPKNNLEARLLALGLYGENAHRRISHSFEKSKRSNWYAEETAQSCNLTRLLLKMSSKKRTKVLRRFEELFGDDGEPLTELSEENITVCRKRIAYVVVTELTPLYQAKRIASRCLFKNLAKKITELLMEQSYAPEIQFFIPRFGALLKSLVFMGPGTMPWLLWCMLWPWKVYMEMVKKTDWSTHPACMVLVN